MRRLSSDGIAPVVSLRCTIKPWQINFRTTYVSAPRFWISDNLIEKSQASLPQAYAALWALLSRWSTDHPASQVGSDWLSWSDSDKLRSRDPMISKFGLFMISHLLNKNWLCKTPPGWPVEPVRTVVLEIWVTRELTWSKRRPQRPSSILSLERTKGSLMALNSIAIAWSAKKCF